MFAKSPAQWWLQLGLSTYRGGISTEGSVSVRFAGFLQDKPVNSQGFQEG